MSSKVCEPREMVACGVFAHHTLLAPVDPRAEDSRAGAAREAHVPRRESRLLHLRVAVVRRGGNRRQSNSEGGALQECEERETHHDALTGQILIDELHDPPPARTSSSVFTIPPLHVPEAVLSLEEKERERGRGGKDAKANAPRCCPRHADSPQTRQCRRGAA
jgi:hypothetical protein